MELYERILSKEEINRRFIIAVTAIMVNKLISSKTGLAESLGVKPAKFSEILNGRMNVGIDMIARMCDFYEVSPDWLLLSRGNNVFRQMAKQTIWVDDDNLNMEYTESEMLNSEISKKNTMETTPNTIPISSAEESIIYKMYQDDKADWKAEKEKKETQINYLQSELLAAKEELATLKTLHSKFQDKEPEYHSKVHEALEAFTSESSGDSGEDSLPTKPPITSKRSSAGKM